MRTLYEPTPLKGLIRCDGHCRATDFDVTIGQCVVLARSPKAAIQQYQTQSYN